MAPHLHRAFLAFWGLRRKESSCVVEAQSAVSLSYMPAVEAGSRGHHASNTPVYYHQVQSDTCFWLTLTSIWALPFTPRERIWRHHGSSVCWINIITKAYPVSPSSGLAQWAMVSREEEPQEIEFRPSWTSVWGSGSLQGSEKGNSRTRALKGFHPSSGTAWARTAEETMKLKVIFLHCQK